MKLLDKIDQIKRIHDLIMRKSTGTPRQLADRLGISERAVYGCLDLMKSMNAPIYYSHHRCSYCYENEVVFSFGFVHDSELLSAKGGVINNPILLEDGFNKLENFCSENS